MSDGLSTYVLSYQDAAGQVFTSRVITNNPNAELDEFNAPYISDMLKAGGYELLSVNKLDELGHEITGGERRGTWKAKLYRLALFVCVAVTIADVCIDYFVSTQLERRISVIEGGYTELNIRLRNRIEESRRADHEKLMRLRNLEEMVRNLQR
jgi:hypothetical protein